MPPHKKRIGQIWRIYVVTGPTGKNYVGQTSRSVRKRWTEHCHCADTSMVIVRAIRKWGKDMFDIEEVANCRTQEDCNLLERFFIISCGALCTEQGYNVSPSPAAVFRSHCGKGHNLAEVGRYGQNGDCAACGREKTAKRRTTPEYRAYFNAYKKAWIAKKRVNNPEFLEQERAYGRVYEATKRKRNRSKLHSQEAVT